MLLEQLRDIANSAETRNRLAKKDAEECFDRYVAILLENAKNGVRSLNMQFNYAGMKQHPELFGYVAWEIREMFRKEGIFCKIDSTTKSIEVHWS